MITHPDGSRVRVVMLLDKSHRGRPKLAIQMLPGWTANRDEVQERIDLERKAG